MAQGSDAPVGAPKLHGTFTMRRLSGAGVVLSRHPTDADPDRVVLAIGDSATNLVLDGTIDEIRSLVADASDQLARMQAVPGGTGTGAGAGAGVSGAAAGGTAAPTGPAPARPAPAGPAAARPAPARPAPAGPAAAGPAAAGPAPAGPAPVP